MPATDSRSRPQERAARVVEQKRRQKRAPTAPASGGATVEKPGMNLASRSDGIP